MSVSRRQLLRALGLGTVGSLAPRFSAFAADEAPPKRVVFFVQPHGHVPRAWKLPFPGQPAGQVATRSLAPLSEAELSPVLRPLHRHREQLLLVEGLAHTSVLFDIAEIQRTGGGDLNNHQVAVAGLLTGTRAAQTPGQRCTGGSRSLDQELALRTVGPGRFGSRVYGGDYVPNQTVSPFSFLGRAQAAPVVHTPQAAFEDLLGGWTPGGGRGGPEQQLAARRASVLDLVAEEYAQVAKRLSAEGRRKLEQHAALVRDLEASVGTPMPSPGQCRLELDATGHSSEQLLKLGALALACDLTRVVTFVAPVPETSEFGYPADAVVHATYAHASVEGNTSCGQVYTPKAEQAMTDLGAWYAKQFGVLLDALARVPEGDGTLLDHTVVVWVPELGTPTHSHEDAFTLLAGGCHRFFKTGQAVRYPQTFTNPLAMFPKLGPSRNQLWVSVLQAMGQSDSTFGLAEARGSDGSVISMRGPLAQLHR